MSHGGVAGGHMRKRAVQDAQASSLSAFDEDPPASGARLVEHRGGLTDVRPQLRYLAGRPHRAGNPPLPDATSQRGPAARARRPDGAPERRLLLNVALLDDQGTRIDGQPVLGHKSMCLDQHLRRAALISWMQNRRLRAWGFNSLSDLSVSLIFVLWSEANRTRAPAPARSLGLH